MIVNPKSMLFREEDVMRTPEGWWVLRHDSHLSRWVEQAKRLDHDQPVLQKLLPYIKEGSLVYDLGAAIGDHTIFYLGAVGPRGTVVAYEPHPTQYECLRRNCPQALCLPYAVGEIEDEVWLFHEPDVVAGSRLIDPARQWPMSRHRRVVIDNTTLAGPVSLMKIDIEGSEVGALRGATETILRHRPTIWIEINPTALERQNSSTGELRHVLEDDLHYQVQEFYPPGSGWDGNGVQANGDIAQCDALLISK
jgi:FkbM family methyltransferase